jgi:hypothetical protein
VRIDFTYCSACGSLDHDRRAHEDPVEAERQSARARLAGRRVMEMHWASVAAMLRRREGAVS